MEDGGEHGGGRTMLHALATRENSLSTFETNKRRLLEIIKEKSLLRGGSFKLASGAVSDYYLDMKPTTFDPEGSFLISEIVFAMLQGDREIDSIGGIELGAVPIVMAVTGRSWPARPLTGFVVRKEKKGHGTDKHIDGNFKPSTNVVLFDDVTTLGGSVIKAIHAVREVAYSVESGSAFPLFSTSGPPVEQHREPKASSAILGGRI
jgi:orotate phosphoribosyltransferase